MALPAVSVQDPVSGNTASVASTGAVGTGRASARSIILPAAAYTTTTNSSTIAAGGFAEIGFYVNVTAVAGTTPSLTVSIQASSDGGTTWFNLVSGTAITAAGTQKIDVGASTTNNTTFGDTVRAVAAITGTTPSFTMSITAIGK